MSAKVLIDDGIEQVNRQIEQFGFELTQVNASMADARRSIGKAGKVVRVTNLRKLILLRERLKQGISLSQQLLEQLKMLKVQGNLYYSQVLVLEKGVIKIIV